MKFIINKPSVWMYKTENLCGEVSDELLYGTVLEIISENDTCVFTETDYGYTGYINKWDLCDCETADCNISESRYIYHRCDVLSHPEYRYAPVMSLPKGARVKIVSEYDGRFSVCENGRKKCYISNHAIQSDYCGSFRDVFVRAAESYIGTPYRWGGKSDNGIDCSGLVFMCATMNGKRVFRDAIPDERYVNIINEKDAKKGDLIYFRGHVAIIADGKEIIHSSAGYGRVIRQDFGESKLQKKDIVCYASIK